jgi:S1-C subfamily serine protease
MLYMKRMMLGALGLMLAIGPAGAQQRMTDQERRETETRLEQLRQELRELERKLGREPNVFRMIPELQAQPWAYSIALGRPRIGVTVNTDASPATDSVGAEIQAVTPDGPAAQAGLQAGDIVVRFNNEALARRGEDRASPGDRLIELARELEEGDTARVQYRRARETRNAVIVARKLDDQAFAYTVRGPETRARVEGLADRLHDGAQTLQQIRLEPNMWVGFGGGWSDMELTTLDADLGAYFGTTEGLLVVRAPKESFLTLKGGDVILRIGGRVPTSPSHAVRILRSYEPGDEVRVEVMRNKARTEVTGTVPERERERERVRENF